METKKIKTTALIPLFLLLLVNTNKAQTIWEERKGCIRSQGNLSPGFLFAQKQATAYLDGDYDLFIDNRVSITGSGFFSFALNRKNQTGIKANHGIFWGMNYHFLPHGKWDPYIGLTPGIGIVQAAYQSGEEIKRTPYTLVPLMSGVIGCNYYIGSIFHFFVKVQGVSGQVFSNLQTPMRLDELKVMAGLGWNMRWWKPKKL
jgi:hypothetical protein